MYKKQTFVSYTSKTLVLRRREKAGCQEKEKGTGQMHSKETQISWGLCLHDITHKISWNQVIRDIPIHRAMYNVILKLLSQSSGRERIENYQNINQIKLSCSNLFLPHRSLAHATWRTVMAIFNSPARKYNTSQCFT